MQQIELLRTYQEFTGEQGQIDAIDLLEQVVLSMDGAFFDGDRPFAQEFRRGNEIVEPDGDFKGVKYAYPSKFPDGRFTVCQVIDHEQKGLLDSDYQKLADEFGLTVPHVRAVMDVESAGSGFILSEPPPARPKILLERHIVYDYTSEPISKTRPDLSNYSPGGYGQSGPYQWTRLEDAMKLNPSAQGRKVLMSCSWGLGQVMGFNYRIAGCETIEQFVVENFIGEYNQARHMLNFIKGNGLIDELLRQDWAAFARAYNGPAYRKNNYDNKLYEAFKRHGGR